MEPNVTLVVLLDANGDYGVGKDLDSAKESYENDIGTVGDCLPLRVLNINLNVTLPQEVTLSADILSEAGAVEMAITG